MHRTVDDPGQTRFDIPDLRIDLWQYARILSGELLGRLRSVDFKLGELRLQVDRRCIIANGSGGLNLGVTCVDLRTERGEASTQ